MVNVGSKGMMDPKARAAVLSEIDAAIAKAVELRGDAAVDSARAEWRARRDEAVAAFQRGDLDSLNGYRTEPEYSRGATPDSPEFVKRLDAIAADARRAAERAIEPYAKAAAAVNIAPEDLARVVDATCAAPYDEGAAIATYSACRGVSWPLARRVAGWARGHGLLIFDPAARMTAEAPGLIMGAVDRAILAIEGRSTERPTHPATTDARGATAIMGELAGALDKITPGIEAECREAGVMRVHVQDACETVTVRNAPTDQPSISAVSRARKIYDASNGKASPDWKRAEDAIERAFRVR